VNNDPHSTDARPAQIPEQPSISIAPQADVAESVAIGKGSKIWHLAQIREGAHIGRDCIVGRGAYVGSGVRVGDNCKIQNYALVYEPATLADGVFVGPAAILTNDQYPRAINPDSTLKNISDWDRVGVSVGTGASIGARAVCVAPVKIGEWALVAAGSTVVKDVPNFALVAGSPARRIGWVGQMGQPLIHTEGSGWLCETSGRTYVETDDELTEVNR
jgi:UDP-2-acetamido-3-amino-2,3-dideoxy-glucuronate N-acetyltransferase